MALEQLEALERTAETGTRAAARRPLADVATVELDATAGPWTKPVTASIRVVFPAPFGPIRPTTSPGRNTSDTSSTACTPPKRTETSWTLERHRRDTHRVRLPRERGCRARTHRRTVRRQPTGHADADDAVRQHDQHDDQEDAERDLYRLVVFEQVARQRRHEVPGRERARRSARRRRSRCRRSRRTRRRRSTGRSRTSGRRRPSGAGTR